MANRTIQQKIFKMKRMRRAHLKKFSMRSAGPTSHPGYINEKGDFIDIGFGSRTQVAKTSFDAYLLTKKKFNVNSNEAIYARTRGLHTDIWPGGTEVILAKRVQSRGNAGSLQGEQKYVYSKLPTDNPNHELRLYISGDSLFFASEMRTATEIIYRISVEYTSVQRAQEARKYGRIAWDKVDRVPINIPST